jgi:hypothetical protein
VSQHRMKLILPEFTVTYYPQGVHCEEASDADLFLINHGTLSSDAIKLGQEALSLTESEIRPFTWITHSAVTRGRDETGPILSEMGFAGYERRPLIGYKERDYSKVHFNVSDEFRAQAVENDEACEGLEYGWLSYPPLVLDGLTGAKLAAAWGDSLICSAHTTLVLMGLGLFPDRPPNAVVPARQGYWFNALARS